MRVSQVTVDFKKTVSDGNYGNETANVQYVVLVDEGEDPDQVVREVIQRARGRAIEELSGSESISVRRALNPPKRVCAGCGNELGDEESYRCIACEQERERLYAQRQATSSVATLERPTGQNGEDIEAEQDLGRANDREDDF